MSPLNHPATTGVQAVSVDADAFQWLGAESARDENERAPEWV